MDGVVVDEDTVVNGYIMGRSSVYDGIHGR